MIRRLMVLTAVAAAAVAVGLPAGASAAGGCVLSGNASFAKPLKLNPAQGSYSFTGSLKNCTGQGVPKSAAVSSTGSGALSCRGSKGGGTATLNWVGGKTSTLTYTIGGAGNAVTVAGKITSGFLAGQKVQALLAFTNTTPTPDKCATTGITKAAFSGVAELGV